MIDLGANIGLVSLYFKDIAKIIYAIEPTPSHYIALCNMISSFSCNNIIPINIAVAQKTTFRKFLFDNNNVTANRIDDNGNITVPCFSIPDLFKYFEIKHIDFMKIDIEGGEIELADSLLSLPIDVIFIECHYGCMNKIISSIQSKYLIKIINDYTFLATNLC